MEISQEFYEPTHQPFGKLKRYECIMSKCILENVILVNYDMICWYVSSYKKCTEKC